MLTSEEYVSFKGMKCPNCQRAAWAMEITKENCTPSPYLMRFGSV